MHRAFLGLLALLCAGCVKTDLPPFPALTRVEVHHLTSNPTLSDPAVTAAVVAFLNDERFGWTRPLGFAYGTPVEVVRASLYDERGWIGEFTVRSSVLPGGHALFEVRRSDVRAYKRVAKSEANRFLDVIGFGGELQ